MESTLDVPLMTTTAQYEYRGTVVLPANDTLVWLEEEMENEHESRCGSNPIT
jgi:hypothetical protein